MNRVVLSQSQRHKRNWITAAASSAALLCMIPSVNAQVSTWTFAGNGNWNTASNWSPVGVPNSNTADVIINDNNALDVTVTISNTFAVNMVRVDLGDLLQLNGRLAVNGATLDGNVNLGTRAEFGLSGTIENSGNIQLSPGTASGDTFIDLLPAGATLTGGGTITIVNGSAFGAITAGGTVTLANQTMQGRGQIGWNRIGIVNQAAGLIRANVSGQTLNVDPGPIGLTNEGMLLAVGGGVLQLTGGDGAYNNAGGMIQAEADSQVIFNGINLTGGTVQSIGTGVVQTSGTSDSFFTDVTINGNIIMGGRGDIGLSGNIVNTGNILFTPGNATSDTLMDVQPAGATLTGGGSITMVAGSSITGTTPGGTLTIADQTIEGRGNFGRNNIAIVNQAGNTIRSNVTGQFMTLDPGTGGLTNQATIEATNGAHIAMTGNGGGSFNNTGGIIRSGNGSEVQFSAGAEVVGGTLESVGTGLFRTTDSNNTIFRNLTVNGYVTTNSRGDLTLLGNINNTGTIQINPGNATSDTILETDASGVTLTGGGAIFMNGNTSTRFTGPLNAPLTIANQTIRGGGWVGSGQLNIDNQANGILHADAAGRILLVDVSTTFTNTGLLQATDQGTLRINDPFTNEGTIHAGASSLVDVNTQLTNSVNGKILGSGAVEVSSLLTNNGRISPGNSVGTLTINMPSSGTVAFGSTSVLDIELAGASSADVLTINGRATLGGQLAVSLLDGYLPDLDDEFTILTSVNPLPGPPNLGTFTNVPDGSVILSADSRTYFTVDYIDNRNVRLSNFDLIGDFDNDGDLDSDDVTALLQATPGPVPPADPQFDINFDGNVVVNPNAPNSDAAHWVEFLNGTAFGDTNLDGVVDFNDLLVVAQNYGTTSSILSWSDGDFDGDINVGFSDLLLIAQNYGFVGLTSSQLEGFSSSFQHDWSMAQSMVPEPTSMLSLVACTMLLRRRRA